MKKIWIAAASAALLAALLFTACETDANGDNDTGTTNGGQGTHPGGTAILSVSIPQGATRLLKLDPEATVTAQLGFLILPPVHTQEGTVTWSSSDTEVATVSTTGLVTAVGGGTATITVTTDGRTAAGTHASGTATVTVVTTDPAIFRWHADTDPLFAGLTEEAPPGHEANIAINTYRRIGGIPVMSMGQELIATVTASGHKGFLLNAAARGDRDPITGMHLEGGAHIRGPSSRMIIGTTDFGVFAPPASDPYGDPVYTELSTTQWAPGGYLNMWDDLRITVYFSDMTSGVTDGNTVPPFNPAVQYGFQVFVLNNTTGLANSPVDGSRIMSDQPNLPPPDGDGSTTARFNGPARTGRGNLEDFISNGFISVFSGFGRQIVIRGVVIEPWDL